MKRHWSFIITDVRYIYPLALLLLVLGLLVAFACKDASHFNRFGNFIIGTGVWVSMRYTLREGINRHKNMANSFPTVPGTNQLNATYFNSIAFAIGDAQLQLHGFFLVILGSIVGSFGDLFLTLTFPYYFS